MPPRLDRVCRRRKLARPSHGTLGRAPAPWHRRCVWLFSQRRIPRDGSHGGAASKPVGRWPKYSVGLVIGPAGLVTAGAADVLEGAVDLDGIDDARACCGRARATHRRACCTLLTGLASKPQLGQTLVVGGRRQAHMGHSLGSLSRSRAALGAPVAVVEFVVMDVGDEIPGVRWCRCGRG